MHFILFWNPAARTSPTCILIIRLFVSKVWKMLLFDCEIVHSIATLASTRCFFVLGEKRTHMGQCQDSTGNTITESKRWFYKVTPSAKTETNTKFCPFLNGFHTPVPLVNLTYNSHCCNYMNCRILGSSVISFTYVRRARSHSFSTTVLPLWADWMLKCW